MQLKKLYIWYLLPLRLLLHYRLRLVISTRLELRISPLSVALLLCLPNKHRY